ncbi:hypothetical protein D3C85_1357760 [compost metagenome]
MGNPFIFEVFGLRRGEVVCKYADRVFIFEVMLYISKPEPMARVVPCSSRHPLSDIKWRAFLIIVRVDIVASGRDLIGVCGWFKSLTLWFAETWTKTFTGDFYPELHVSALAVVYCRVPRVLHKCPLGR